MRRLVLFMAVPLAALLAVVVLWSAWSERAARTTRARSHDAAPRADAAAGDAAGQAPAAAADGDGNPTPTRVRGVVTGRTGGLWGARVVAYRTGSDEVLGETHTNPEGIYILDVEPDVAFDLSVEPIDLTGLLPTRREGITVQAGEEREEVVALVEGAVLEGRVADEDGTGQHRIEILAVRPGDTRDLSTLPGVPAELVAARTTTGAHGRFRLHGLPPGAYELVVGDPEWMFPDRVTARTDGPEPSLLIVPALTLDLRVKDAETEEPIAAFAVRARIGDRVLLDAEGRDGVFSRRTRWPGPRQRPYHLLVEVAAGGLVAPEPFTASERVRHVWLWPERDPNTTVRISFDDGTLYRGPLVAHFRAKSSMVSGNVRFDRDRDGAYHAALPRGQWDLSLIPAGLYGNRRLSAEATVAEGRDEAVGLVLPAGGTLHIFPPPGADMAEARIREVDEGGSRNEVPIAVPHGGALVEGIPQGAYQVGYKRDIVYEGTSYDFTQWFRDVRMVAGATERILLPE